MRFKGTYLLESDVKYAALNCKSNAACAAFLNISVTTWRKYASMYYDSETGKTYHELLMWAKPTSRVKHARKQSLAKIDLSEISLGHYPAYPLKTFIKRLITEGYKAESCSSCGFNERNLLSGKVPLHLNFNDGNNKNWKFDNVDFLCFNCCALLTDLKVTAR